MKFERFTIVLSVADVDLINRAAPLWNDVPGVSPGVNKLRKPEWSRVVLALDQYTFTPKPDRQQAAKLSGDIYGAIENRRCKIEEVMEADPVPAAKRESQGSLF